MSLIEENPFSSSQVKEAVPQAVRATVSWRAVLIGCLLIPINCYWIMQMEIVRYMNFPTTVSLFFNCIFSLLLLVIANVFLRRLTPRWALTQAEMLTVYLMLTLASSLCGHDMVQVLGGMMSYSTWFSTPENRWQELFANHLPSWLLVQDMEVLKGFYLGNSNIFDPMNLQGWLPPVLAWTGFIVVLLFMMLCINTLLRKQWAERERLSYPLIMLPIEMTDPRTNLFRNRLMWIGFVIAAFIDLLNGLNTLFPSIPMITVKAQNYAGTFTTKPWNQMGEIMLGFYPFVIGLGALLPVDLSFSCWFFWVFWKAQLAITSLMGWGDMPGFPYIEFQSFGAYMGIAGFSLYISRKALLDVLRRTAGMKSDVTDEDEAISYRTAVIGILLGMGLMVAFSLKIGMSIWITVLFFGIYFLLSLAITRMRAELGPPAHDLHFAGPDRIVAAMIGPGSLGPGNLSGLTMFFWFNRAYRSHPMPIQLESYKIAERQRMNYRRVFIAMMLAVIIGTLASFWAYLSLCYDRGAATARVVGPKFGWEAYNRLGNWLTNPTPVDAPGLTAVGVGTGLTLLLQALRMRFFWFPFHPVGYAVSASWVMQRLWMALFISWLVKLLILRYGGLKTFQKAIPFFLGLVLGEFVVGSLWAILGIIFDIRTYSFFI